MDKTCIFDKEKNKLICKICNMEVDTSFLDKRCPRCNNILRIPPCENCKKCK